MRPFYSTMCRYFCIGFIDFMLKSKSLSSYANFFPPSKYEKNDKKILTYFLTKKEKTNYLV